MRNPDQTPQQTLRKRELAMALRCCGRTIDGLMARREIPFLKFGRSVRFDLNDVLAALRRDPVS